jgi:hypothetical protein
VGRSQSLGQLRRVLQAHALALKTSDDGAAGSSKQKKNLKHLEEMEFPSDFSLQE